MPKSRTVYKVDIDKIYKYAALLNSGGVNKPWSMAAVQLLTDCVYAQKGAERREITPEETAKLIERGYKLTG
jgi:hypothetical protein